MKESLYNMAGNLEEELQALEQPANPQVHTYTSLVEWDCPFPSAE